MSCQLSHQSVWKTALIAALLASVLHGSPVQAQKKLGSRSAPASVPGSCNECGKCNECRLVALQKQIDKLTKALKGSRAAAASQSAESAVGISELVVKKDCGLWTLEIKGDKHKGTELHVAKIDGMYVITWRNVHEQEDVVPMEGELWKLGKRDCDTVIVRDGSGIWAFDAKGKKTPVNSKA